MWHQFESVTQEEIAEDPKRNIQIEHTMNHMTVWNVLLSGINDSLASFSIGFTK